MQVLWKPVVDSRACISPAFAHSRLCESISCGFFISSSTNSLYLWFHSLRGFISLFKCLRIFALNCNFLVFTIYQLQSYKLVALSRKFTSALKISWELGNRPNWSTTKYMEKNRTQNMAPPRSTIHFFIVHEKHKML